MVKKQNHWTILLITCYKYHGQNTNTITSEAHVKEARYRVYPKKYAHGFVVLCFFVVMQSFIMNSHEIFIHIHQDCFAVKLPQCQWSKPDGYGKISQFITVTKHSKAKTVCTFLGIYCNILSCQNRLYKKSDVKCRKAACLSKSVYGNET